MFQIEQGRLEAEWEPLPEHLMKICLALHPIHVLDRPQLARFDQMPQVKHSSMCIQHTPFQNTGLILHNGSRGDVWRAVGG